MNTRHEPLKRHPALVPYSREHHEGLLLVWKIRQGLRTGIEATRITEYVTHFFQYSLAPHFDREERFLFTKLAYHDPVRIQALEEHREIRKLLELLKNPVSLLERLTAFADRLEAHIRFEERYLFNHLQHILPEEELQVILEKTAAESLVAETHWEDPFWLLKK